MLPNAPERIHQELELHIGLGRTYIMTRGYAAPEVQQTYSRAYELCRHVQETQQLFPALYGLWQFYWFRADLLTAYELGEQLLSLTQRQKEPFPLAVAHYVLGTTLYYRGAFVAAQAHLEQSIPLYDPQRHTVPASLYGINPKINSLIIQYLRQK